MTGGKSKAQLQAELSELRSSRAVEGWVTILNSLIRWGAIVLVARYAYLSLLALAGKMTVADIGIGLLANLGFSHVLSFSVTVGALWYALKQRTLRRDTVEHLHGRIRSLEKDKDPRRSSSHLTPRGDTRREDRI